MNNITKYNIKSNKNHSLRKALFFLFFLFVQILQVCAQRTAIKDSIVPGKTIEIIGADRYAIQDKGDSIGKLISLAGKAKVKQEKTWFDADSIVLHQKENYIEAFGHIHINDSDSVHTYADYLKYLGKERKAYLKNNVRLSDGKGTLTTNNLDYDVGIKLGTYSNGGKIVNGKTTITSKQGYYYGETRDVYFYTDAAMLSPDTRVFSDTLLYNLNTEIMTYVSPTSIYNNNRKIKTSSGFYNAKTKQAQFGKRPEIEDSAYTLTADEIAFEDSSGKGEARGNAVYKSKDKKNGYDLLANNIKSNSKSKTLLATEKPVLFIKQDEDTIYVSADTIYSTKYNDINKAKDLLLYTDSVKKIHKFNFDKDSSNNRYFEAYHHVKIYHDSVQAIADSMYYSSLDSVFRLFYNPIVWSQDNQITGDTMYLFVKNKNPEKLLVFENAMAISKVNDIYYNQLKGNSITGLFKEDKISLLITKGSPAQNVYYAQDETKKLVGVNQSFADQINIEFDNNNKPERVLFINNLSGTMFPIKQVNHKEIQVKDFKWLIDLRPKNKFAVIGE